MRYSPTMVPGSRCSTGSLLVLSLVDQTSASGIAARTTCAAFMGAAFVLFDGATAHARRAATSELIDGYASPLGSVIFTVAVALALDGANSALVVDAGRLGRAVVRR